ncbi:hypothetical protein [Cryptosporangium aurantiacum]|uniref:Uncharacterized protein n=1 Tax=Cryptosporangium aurantiacum TaxID=134849 RepID=A0A1M7NQ39_9ACTN|nr:hypothetical protein [Cryptosporangium aurantiacum]SHN05887.1 hypothetical protein SAMN05443668_102764 [Cryptosporangium aurantiacum]
MNTGPQGWHQGGADELRPPTGVLRRGAAPDWPARPVVARPLPTTVLWRWRYELAALLGAPLLWWASVQTFGGLTGLSIVTGVLAVVALVPPLRRWAFAVLWTVVTPHRIRVACAEAGVVSSRGKLPAVLFTRRKSYGERVYLWCPDGVGSTDVAAARPAIAAACWAHEVHFYETNGQYPHLVAVEVVRHRAEVTEAEDGTLSALWARFARHGGRFEGFAPRG